MFLSAISSSLLAEVADVSVEVAGDIVKEGKSGILSVVEQFVVDDRDWCDNFFGGKLSMDGLSAVAETFGRLRICIAATTPPLHRFDVAIGDGLVYQ